MMQPTPSCDARERVFAAANQLFEETDRQVMPTVDQVRRLAKVDMHAATAAMREWRRQQTAQAAPIAVAVPETVAKANEQAVAMLWTQAQELANRSLREAQAAWDAERAELDQMRIELSDAFEAQADELELAKSRIAALENEARETAAAAATEIQKVRAELVAATTRAERAHADVDRGRTELKKAMADAEGLRGELAGVKAKAEAAEQSYQERRKEAAKEAQRCADKVAAAQAERDQVAKEAAEARENAARLAGQLEAVQSQNAALMEALRGKAAGDA